MKSQYTELGVVLVRWASDDPGASTITFHHERPEIYDALLDWARQPEQHQAQHRPTRRIYQTLRRIIATKTPRA